MKALLKRPSLLLFLAILAAGLLGPFMTPLSPFESAGAPFARPLWWNSALSLSKKAVIRLHHGELSLTGDLSSPRFLWKKGAPAFFALEGQLTAEPGQVPEILWKTPVRSFSLLSGRSGAGGTESRSCWVNLDSRDILFKQSLGLPLIGRGTDALFPAEGAYAVELRGISSAELTLNLPGQRQGVLGTDQRGRDVFTRFLCGIRVSLIVGICATAAATLLGLLFGLTAGYMGGVADALIMRLVDILLAIPTLPILMTLAGLWGKGLWQMIAILSIFSWMGTARSVRALVLSVREAPWVEGLRALGCRPRYIVRKHLLRETAPVILANLALGVPGAVLAEAGLAFLGLSDPRIVSWGRMLHEAHSFGAFTEGAWWLILPPGLGIVALCLIFMDLGRFLEERIDPRLKEEHHA